MTAVPSIRRTALHLCLALWTTPLPGAILVATRLLARRRFAAAAGTVTLGSAWLAVGCGLAFGPAVHWGVVAVGLVLVWSAAGLATAVVERRTEVVPARPGPAGRRPVVQGVAWAVALPVGSVWLVLSMTAMFSPWGSEVVAKPSMPDEAMAVALLVVAPIGLAWGLLRSGLGRPARPAPLVVFPLALLTQFLVMAVLAVVFQWGTGELFDRPIDPSASGLGVMTDTVLGILFVFGILVATAFEMSEARGAADFSLRTLLGALLVACLLLNGGLLFGQVPEAVRHELAEGAAEAEEHGVATGHRRWLVERRPMGPRADEALEAGVAEALLAGDAAAARGLLERVEELTADRPEVRLERAARGILASRLDLSTVHRVDVEPIDGTDAASASWNGLLTAVAAARPELSQPDLEHGLQELSASWEETELPDPEALDTVRVMAHLFDCRLLALDPGAVPTVLDEGVPVLFVSFGGEWRLVEWLAPEADALLWLDPAEVGDDDGASGADLPGLPGDPDEEGGSDPRPRMRRLDAWSGLSARTVRDGGGFFALVPAEDAPDASVRWGVDPGGTVERARLERARAAVVAGDVDRAVALAGELPAGSGREELHLALGIHPSTRGRLPETIRRRVEAELPEALAPERLEQVSYWLLVRLGGAVDRDLELACAHGLEIFEARLARRPQSEWMTHRLLALAVHRDRAGRVAELAEGLAWRDAWSEERVLEALEWAVGAWGGGADGEVRRVVGRLVDRLGWLLEVDARRRLRSSLPAYRAARAVLAQEPEDAVDWARRAVELEPDAWAYQRVLAQALEGAGRLEEAAAAARTARRQGPPPLCPGAGVEPATDGGSR